MKIYFDNNIFISIEDGEIDYNAIKKRYSTALFVYSYIHIQELLEAQNNFDSLKQQRLNTITTITNNYYIYPPNGTIKIENPENIISIIKTNMWLSDMFKMSVNNVNVNRIELLNILGIEEKRMNNYTPNEVIEYINKATTERIFLKFGDWVDLAGATLHERICTLFNFLDILGFWKDKKNKKSKLARIYDASHAFFATNCDMFVSNDLRTRNKAKVAYLMYNINTKVLSYNEFLEYK